MIGLVEESTFVVQMSVLYISQSNNSDTYASEYNNGWNRENKRNDLAGQKTIFECH